MHDELEFEYETINKIPECKYKAGDKRYIVVAQRLQKIHILAIIDEYQVVFKWYGKFRQYWHYEIEHKDTLNFEIYRAKKFRNEQRKKSK